MSKAILILDKMPECCTKCHWMSENHNYCCAIPAPLLFPDICRHSSCPIRPLPESREPDWTQYDGGYADGWNDCLDAILGRGSDD